MAASFGLIMVGALAGGALYGKKPGVAAVGLAVAAYFALWAFLHKRARGYRPVYDFSGGGSRRIVQAVKLL